MQTKVTDRYAAIIKRKLSGLDCFLSSFSLLHRNAQSLLLRYLELLCRHFYRCTRDSFNTKQKLVPTSNFWFFISFATLSTSRLYPGPRGPSCDLSLLVGSCKPPHFTSAGGIHTNNLHVSINSCDFVRSPACAAASRAHAYGSCNSLNTSCGVISKPHFEVLGRGAFFFSRHKSASLPHTKGHWDQQPQWTLWLPCQSAFTSCASHNCIGSAKYLKTVLRLSPPGSKELWKRWRQCRRQRQEVLWGTAGRSAAPQGSRGQAFSDADLSLTPGLQAGCCFFHQRELSTRSSWKDGLYLLHLQPTTSSSPKLNDSDFGWNEKNREVADLWRYLGLMTDCTAAQGHVP